MRIPIILFYFLISTTPIFAQSNSQSIPNTSDLNNNNLILGLALSLNGVKTSFDKTFFDNYAPEDRAYIAPSLKLELYLIHFFQFGLEYRRERFSTQYEIAPYSIFNEDFGYLDYGIIVALPKKTSISMDTFTFVAGVGLPHEALGFGVWAEFGLGFGKTSWQHDSFGFIVLDNSDAEQIKSLANDFLIPENSSISLFSLGLRIDPYENVSIGIHAVQNKHRGIHKLVSERIGPDLRTPYYNVTPAPFTAILNISFRFTLLKSWHRDSRAPRVGSK